MIKNYLIVAFTAAILLFSRQSYASHAMGADLTYNCLGGNQYEITVKFYRDCRGILPFCISSSGGGTSTTCTNGVCTTCFGAYTCAAYSNPYVMFRSSSCGVSDSFALNPYPSLGSRTEVTPICTNLKSTCRDNCSPYPGAEEWVYKGIVTLPTKCSDWIFSVAISARNNAINTIVAPGSSNIYIEAMLDNTVSCNNSPDFSNYPVPWVCVGKQFCFNHGAIDPDGDSLVYSLVDPQVALNTPVTFIAPYTATNPVSSNPALTINSVNGDICMTPTTQQVAVMAVRVNKYRNGKLIGFVTRDMQIVSVPCTNNLPTASGIDGTTNYSMTVCAGMPACFDIFTNDLDPADILTVTWNNGIPAGTLTFSAGSHPTAHFCWNTTLADASTVPYTFTVTAKDNACPYNGFQTFAYSILVKTNCLLLVTNSLPNVICKGNCSDLTSTPTGGTAPFNYVWSDGPTGSTRNVCPTSTTTYTCTVTDSKGLTAVDTAMITVNNLPTIGISPNTSVCQGASATLTSSGGGTYLWTPTGSVSSTITVNPSATTTYNLAVTTAQGCVDSAKVTVTVNNLPVLIATNSAAICLGASTVLTVTGAQTYSWTPAGVGGVTTGNSLTVSPSSSTLYSVTGTDNNGCTGSTTVSVTVNQPPVVGISPPTAICSGGSTTLTASGGGNYLWNPGGAGSSITVNPTSTTPYTVTVTDVNNCTASANTSVTVNQLPVVNINPPVAICNGNSTTLTVGGSPANYIWTPGGPGASITVSPNTTTTYSVVATDANNCSASAGTSVTVNALPIPGITPNSAICKNSSITLTASGGTQYLWNPGGAGSSITVTPLATTTYTVTVTDGNSCTAETTTTVTVNPFLTVTMSPDTSICTGANAVLTANAPGANSWTWYGVNGNTSIVTVAPTATTTYSVDLADVNGCKGSGVVTVTVNPLPNIGAYATNPSICIGTSTTVNGTGGIFYSWSAPISQAGTSIPVTPSPPGVYNYTVTGTDGNGCINTATTTVTVNALPAPTISAPQSICTGTPTTITAGGGTNYVWSPAGNGSSITVTPSSTSTYTVTVTDGNGCSDTISTSIIVNPFLTVNVQPSTICFGQSTTLTAVSSGATGYSWSTGDLTQTATVNPIITTTYTVNVNNNFGCNGSTTVTVNVNQLPVIGITPNSAICSGQSFTLTASGGNIYNWTASTGGTFTGSSITVNPASSTTYSLTVTDGNGCSDSTATDLTVNPLPVVAISPPAGFCNGSNVQLTASGGTNYVWYPGGAVGSSITVSPSTNTTYSVGVSDINGCTGSATVDVTVYPVPLADAGPDLNICEGETTQLRTSNVSGLWSYSWTPSNDLSDPTASNPIFSGLSTSTYILQVSAASSNCPPALDTVTVIVHPIPTITAGGDTSVIAGTEVQLTSVATGNVQWFPPAGLSCINCSSPLATPLHTTIYVVTTTDSIGCRNRDTVVVNVEDIITLYIPNAFTPYKDGGRNPIFYAFGEGVHDFEFYIFDRWGEAIFKSTNIYVGWDGTYQGRQVQDDVYIYYAKAKSITGKSITRTGSVTVVR